jgi:threonine dehydrogenase-like Zn-dependent dehydrogenase
MVSRHFAKAISWLAGKNIDIGLVISQKIKLEDAPMAFETMKEGNVAKIVIEM